MSRQLDTPASVGETKTGTQRWREGIAVVGLSARFPGCRSVDEYWKKVAAGESLLSKPTDDELRAAGVDPESSEAMHFVRSGTHLEDAESFDAGFFDISRREAEILDPQQRIFLECAYEALEHAGMTGDGERVGVFAGIGMNTYLLQLLGNQAFLATAGGYQLMLGNDKDFLATRVAYKLNLRGPAVTVQTACSTSLAAVHLACQSLLLGESDAALAGGVSVMFPQLAGYPYIPGMILSPDGYCRPFDEKAHGTVPGRGAGIVVLKRVSDAVAAGDTIYGVIAGSAWNNDGSDKVGYTAPSVDGQASVIRAAHAAAGVTADRIGYVEAHGTGTELGDPIEVAALAAAFGTRSADAGKCVLGSVKANMGHGDVAAGVAGLIKAVLAVHHGVIPPTPHFEKANPALGLEQTAFVVSAKSSAWPAGEPAQERWAGVSSFGIGGTNVHLCLKSAPPVAKGVLAETGPWVFPLSAKTASALGTSVARLAEFAEAAAGPDLAGFAATLQSGRRRFAHRRAVVAGSREELLVALQKSGKAVGKTEGDISQKEKQQVVFLFPGQGQQFAGMAATLYAEDIRFRNWIDRGLAILPKSLAGRTLDAICGFEAGLSGSEATETDLGQPLLFLVEYALAMRWMELGVQPDLLVGHSLGELTAAAVAGVFSFEDGLRLAVRRGQLMDETAAGAMLAVSLPVEEIGPYLTEDLWIAAENGPKLTVVSGLSGAVDAAEERFSRARVATIRLKTNRAFHSPHMAEAASKFYEAVKAVERHAPRLRWLSNVTGGWISADEAMSPQYWADQMTARVRFAENAAVLAGWGAQKPYFLLEVGPGDTLVSLVGQQVRELGRRRKSASREAAPTGLKMLAASSLGGTNRHGNDLRMFLEAAAKFWESGADLVWELLPGFRAGDRRRVALPTYPFERERYWVEATQAFGVQADPRPNGPAKANGKRSDLASWFYAPSWQRTPAATLVLGKRAEPVAAWLLLEGGSGTSQILAGLAAGLGQTGTRVLRCAADFSRPEQLWASFEAFWREHREVVALGPIGLLDCSNLLADGTGSATYRNLLSLLQTAQKAKVRFAQMDFVVDALADVHGERVEGPARAVVEGIARVVAIEFPGVPTRVIDPGIPEGMDPVLLAGSILAEIGTVALPGMTVAYRGNTRWQQVWQPVRLEGQTSSALRPGGTYVITGGLGGVGFVLARHLLGKYGANVVMVGRTTLPHRERWEEWLTEQGPLDPTSRRIARAKELENAGGSLLLLSADVADAVAMQSVWATVEGKFGRVHGVIHAAGIGGGARISAQDHASAEELFRPKIAGSQVLAGLLQGKQADFLLFCSSISAVIPVGGDSAYAAANTFQDRYATWCRQHLDVPSVSLNFEAWREIGMAAEREIEADFEHLRQERFKTAITSDEGVEIFERALLSGEAQILVSTVDLQGLLPGVVDQSFRVVEKAPTSAADTAVSEESGGVAAATESEETLAVMAIWRELLGVDSIKAEDNFFELGGHSLLGTMVLARIRERFGVELSIRAIFDAPTPEGLGNRIQAAGAGELRRQLVGVPGDPGLQGNLDEQADREEFEF